MKKCIQKFDYRQNIQSDSFEIFHYRDSEPSSVSVHHHDFYEIYLLLDGEVTYWIEGKNYNLKAGELLLISPQEIHQPFAKSDSTYERIVLWINRNFLAELSSEDIDLSYCFRKNGNNIIHPHALTKKRLHELMESLAFEYHNNELGSSLYSIGLFYQLMVEIYRLSVEDTSSVKTIKNKDIISQVVDYINKHCNESISLDELAKKFYVSKYYLSHEFTKQSGTSLYKYIILKRLMNAREQIAAGQAPGEVFKSCGFGDYTTFYRAFKSEYGISPREFAANTKR